MFKSSKSMSYEGTNTLRLESCKKNFSLRGTRSERYRSSVRSLVRDEGRSPCHGNCTSFVAIEQFVGRGPGR